MSESIAVKSTHSEGGPSVNDQGFTLIELLVYIALLGLVLAVVSSLLISAIQGQGKVSSLNSSASTGQIASRSLVEGIRNASGFKVAAATSAGQMVQARVGSVNNSGAVTWRCQAWYFSASKSTFYSKTSSTAAVAAPDSTFSGWTSIATGISLPSGVTAPFTGASSRLSIDFLVAGDRGTKLRITTTSTSQPQSDSTTGPVTCF